MTVRVVYGVGCLLHLHVKVILTTSYGRRGISAPRFFYCICPWGAAGGNIYNMNMKKTLLLILLALLAAPLWGQKASDYRAAAERGDKVAQYNLGVCYDNGMGVAQDYKQAVYWYTKAANQGDLMAQYFLGVCYNEGRGVAQDYKQAVYWYTKAANQGHAGAQYSLGFCYYNGEGVAQDYKQAVYWWTKVANLGNDMAQFCLGFCYYKGEGVAQDYKQAVYWWTKAANRGHAQAQYRLGGCYLWGEGVEEDCGAARYWALQAEKKRDELYDREMLVALLAVTKDCTPQKPADPTSTTAPRTTTPTTTSTTPRSPVSTSTSTSTPSYSYSGSSKYGRWPWYYHGVDYGVHFAYIQRAIYARDAVSGETGYADVFGEEGWSKGFQVGMHFNPLDDKEILAMNSGFYLEMLFDKWENAPSGYYDNYYEFNLHVPLEMVLYLPFGRESALHLRAGLGADFSCLAKVTDWDDSYMPSQEVDYGEGFINRFNLSLNLGVSFRFEGVMLHATYQKGLLGHPFSAGYRCTLDKLSLGLSFVVDD